jgi:peptidoglycan/xylan/chitin deacetylase (PgdA/CDA1 family)
MKRPRKSCLLVLGWHNVSDTWCFPAERAAGMFGLVRQLRILRSVTTVVPLGAALADLAAGRPLPQRAVAITFDDGYRDTLTLAGPLLRELRLPATCFLVPGILGRSTRAWWEELACAVTNARAPEIAWEGLTHSLRTRPERNQATASLLEALKGRDRAAREAALDELTCLLEPTRAYSVDEQFMDWDEALRLREYMEIGSHSLHHAILSRESADEQSADLCTARAQLQARLGVTAAGLAYPNGTAADHSPDTIAAARQAGHSWAVTTRRGLNDLATPHFEVRRTVMAPERGVTDLRKLVRDVFTRGTGPSPDVEGARRPSARAVTSTGDAPRSRTRS